MGFFRRKSRWAGVDMMDLVPLPLVEHDLDPGTLLVTLKVPRFREPLIGKYMQRLLPAQRKFILVTLEERGSYLWRAMDGQRSLGALVDVLQRDFPDDMDKIHERTAIYFTSLYQNNFIDFLASEGLT